VIGVVIEKSSAAELVDQYENTSAVENGSSHFQYARANVRVGESAEVNSTIRLDPH
jgi:hypothetical protein